MARMPGGDAHHLQVQRIGGNIRLTRGGMDPGGKPKAGGLNDRTRALVIDLDVVLTDPAGRRHYPWSLDPDCPGKAATRSRPNDRDNIERIDVEERGWSREVGPVAVTGRRPAHGNRLPIALPGTR